MGIEQAVRHATRSPTAWRMRARLRFEGALRVRPRATVTLLAALATSLILTAGTAQAHVKWFVACDVADDPLPFRAVFTPTFWLLASLFVVLFCCSCTFERSRFGVLLQRVLDRWTDPLHRRDDHLLRAVTAISFALLWADGGLLLTPELKASSVWISAIQVLVPIYLFGRATLPAAGAGILILYGYGVAAYGLFHMLDYPVFVGLGAYFVMSVDQRLLAWRRDVLRWSVALSLLWPAMEKFVYPAWIAPILMTHPHITLGFDVAFVITAAGVVEFGLAFALLWTPLMRRLGAAALSLLLVAATFEFGKVDGIGHLLIISVLLVIFADPGRRKVEPLPAFAALTSGAVLLAVIFIYSGLHALAFHGWPAARFPLEPGASLLAVVFLCLNGHILALAPVAVRGVQRLIPAPRRSGRGSTGVSSARAGMTAGAGRARAVQAEAPETTDPAWPLDDGDFPAPPLTQGWRPV